MDGADRPNFTERCRLSDPLFPHSLRRRDNPPSSECFRCGPLRYEFEEGGWHYYCDICKVVFHNDNCHVLPQGMRHPHHPNHTLNTAIQYSETEIFSFNRNLFEISMFLAVVAPILIHDRSFEIDSDKTCDWCKEKLGRMFHHCHECNFSMGICCIWKDPPFKITTPRSHHHSLTFFYNPISLPCNVCGLGDNKEPRYACISCNYLVHKSCIDRPQVKVNKLTQFQRRLLPIWGLFLQLSLCVHIILLSKIFLPASGNRYVEFVVDALLASISYVIATRALSI